MTTTPPCTITPAILDLSIRICEAIGRADAGDELEVDFTGTSPQTSGALNLNYWFTVSCAYAAIRACLAPAIPNNEGFYRPIRVIAPEGSFVNPRFPAPVGARGQS